MKLGLLPTPILPFVDPNWVSQSDNPHGEGPPRLHNGPYSTKKDVETVIKTKVYNLGS